MLLKLNQRAQTTAEYAILIAIVIGAVVAMQAYIRRGMQGRIKDAVDYVPYGETGSSVGGTNLKFTDEQYEPYYTSSEAATARSSQERELLGTGGEVGRKRLEQTLQTRQQVSGWGEKAEKQAALTADYTSVKDDRPMPTINTAAVE